MEFKKVFIPELNCFGYQKEFTLRCNNWPLFFRLCNTEWLKTMMISAQEDENYEMCDLIKKEMDSRPSQSIQQ